MHSSARELLNELGMVHGDECGCGKGAIWVRGQAWVWFCSGRVHRLAGCIAGGDLSKQFMIFPASFLTVNTP